MEVYNLKNMKGGWFIGDFHPSILKTKDFEVAIKNYKKGDIENSHFHKIATEYTVIVTGEVKMFGRIFCPGEIIKVEKFDTTSFEAITDAVTVVVKFPSVTNDKYLDNYGQ